MPRLRHQNGPGGPPCSPPIWLQPTGVPKHGPSLMSLSAEPKYVKGRWFFKYCVVRITTMLQRFKMHFSKSEKKSSERKISATPKLAQMRSFHALSQFIMNLYFCIIIPSARKVIALNHYAMHISILQLQWFLISGSRSSDWAAASGSGLLHLTLSSLGKWSTPMRIYAGEP